MKVGKPFVARYTLVQTTIGCSNLTSLGARGRHLTRILRYLIPDMATDATVDSSPAAARVDCRHDQVPGELICDKDQALHPRGIRIFPSTGVSDHD